MTETDATLASWVDVLSHASTTTRSVKRNGR
jgi:hypothetical protein